jgi:hypothetical protein
MATTQTVQITSELAIAITDEMGTYRVGGERVRETLAYGTGAGQADLSYSKVREIVNSATPLTLDLNGGGLLTSNGAAADFVSITTIRIRNLDATQTITIGGGTNAPAWANFPPLGPGGRIDVHNDAGWVVTPGTGDILEIVTDGGSNVRVEINLVGRSA